MSGPYTMTDRSRKVKYNSASWEGTRRWRGGKGSTAHSSHPAEAGQVVRRTLPVMPGMNERFVVMARFFPFSPFKFIF